MAFPGIPDSDTISGNVTSNATSWSLIYPTNVVSTDLLVAFVATDGDTQTTGPTWPAGWTQLLLVASSGAVTLQIFVKIADGTETGTFTVTQPASEQGAWRIFRVTNTRQSTASSSMGVGVATGATANPDPPSKTMSYGTDDTLWFAACAADTSRTISVYPLADRNSAQASGGAGGATLGLCTTTSAVATLDPGQFTISTSDDWTAATLGIRPLAPPPPGPLPIVVTAQATRRAATW